MFINYYKTDSLTSRRNRTNLSIMSSGWDNFMTVQFPIVRAEYLACTPDASAATVAQDVMKEIMARWKDMSQDEKNVYINMSQL